MVDTENIQYLTSVQPRTEPEVGVNFIYVAYVYVTFTRNYWTMVPLYPHELELPEFF